ncbi:MAG TPA: DinB family protein [Thermoanaerobaculia bacterium]|nr:DinB family protein [Thermoanaerobaculia bacterium]
MKRTFATTAVLLSFLAGVPAMAQEAKPQTPAAAPAAKPASSAKSDILWQIRDAEKKLVQLAEATPAEKFGWRPAEGVRTTGEVFMHVAGANYFFPTFWGGKIPDGMDPRGFEKMGGDKAKVVETLKASFAHVTKSIEELPDAELDKQIKLFGNDSTVRMAVLIVATHGHEHLGQSIAYARSNGITPPWSRQGE